MFAEAKEGMAVAVHEAFHAMYDQADVDLSNWEEEVEAAAASWYEAE